MISIIIVIKYIDSFNLLKEEIVIWERPVRTMYLYQKPYQKKKACWELLYGKRNHDFYCNEKRPVTLQVVTPAWF